MVLHPEFSASPHAVLKPEIRQFPFDFFGNDTTKQGR